MDLADRLAAAMKHAKLNQPQLEDVSRVKQQTIHKILSRKQKTSSETVKLAIACHVRPEWLSEGLGEMVDDVHVEDERIKHIAMVCKSLPDYAVDQLVQQSDALTELIEKTKKTTTGYRR